MLAREHLPGETSWAQKGRDLCFVLGLKRKLCCD